MQFISMDETVAQSTARVKGGLIQEVRRVIRFKHYSIRTEDTYIQWIRRFILFH